MSSAIVTHCAGPASPGRHPLSTAAPSVSGFAPWRVIGTTYLYGHRQLADKEGRLCCRNRVKAGHCRSAAAQARGGTAPRLAARGQGALATRPSRPAAGTRPRRWSRSASLHSGTGRGCLRLRRTSICWSGRVAPADWRKPRRKPGRDQIRTYNPELAPAEPSHQRRPVGFATASPLTLSEYADTVRGHIGTHPCDAGPTNEKRTSTMNSFAALAVKEAATASGHGASLLPAIAPSALDGFAVGALLSALCVLLVMVPRHISRRTRQSARTRGPADADMPTRSATSAVAALSAAPTQEAASAGVTSPFADESAEIVVWHPLRDDAGQLAERSFHSPADRFPSPQSGTVARRRKHRQSEAGRSGRSERAGSPRPSGPPARAPPRIRSACSAADWFRGPQGQQGRTASDAGAGLVSSLPGPGPP